MIEAHEVELEAQVAALDQKAQVTKELIGTRVAHVA
jgi:hypothetical protein